MDVSIYKILLEMIFFSFELSGQIFFYLNKKQTKFKQKGLI